MKANGKIAMKLLDGERLIGVAVCTDANDILLAAKSGKAIRFPVDDVRVFASRASTGVRGIKLEEGDEVVSMSVLRHIDVETEERDAYLRYATGEAPQHRRGGRGARRIQWRAEWGIRRREHGHRCRLVDRAHRRAGSGRGVHPHRDEKGYGKRSSAYEYRTAGRGGQGIANIEVSSRNGNVTTSFPVEETDQIMLVTDAGKLIRTEVHDIRIARRQTQGVTIFKVADDERVVAVAQLSGMAEEGPESEGENGDESESGGDSGSGGEGNGGK